MEMGKAWLALAVALVLVAACKPQDELPQAATVPATQAAGAGNAGMGADTAAQGPAAIAVAPSTVFDFNALPVSTVPLPAWPYIVPPSGYAFFGTDPLGMRTKDLARIPVWTGGQLVWVEGKVFSSRIQNADGKTFSRFELRKGLHQQIEALGGVRLSQRSYDENTYRESEKELSDFRQEFADLSDAYGYDRDMDSYAIRRGEGAIWVVVQARNHDASILVAEGPLPTAAE